MPIDALEPVLREHDGIFATGNVSHPGDVSRWELRAMAYRKKSWREKLEDDKGLPKVFKIEGRLSKRWGTGTCVIPAPREVDEVMRSVPRGKLTTINAIRAALAKKHRATIGCPITTGIFAWVAAHAAEEARAEGKKRITPWWRTLKGDGILNEKYPGGAENQRRLLEGEGHRVVTKGKRPFVDDLERKMARL